MGSRALGHLAGSILLVLVYEARAEEAFNIPLRISMGGVETEDSFGRIWLGEGPGAGDPLNIRPDDRGGAQWIENWEFGRFQPDSLEALGFDPFHPGDSYIFNTIRWDVGGDGLDFRMEIPIPNGKYLVNMYFTEGCCTGRHFKIEIQGEIVDEDVSYLDYDPVAPALGRTGRLTFEGIAVVDGILKIGLLPCPECPGAADTNAIIDALEVVSGPGCDHQGLDLNCLYSSDTGQVRGTWKNLAGADAYRILKDGQPFADLPSTAFSFTDPAPGTNRLLIYTLQALDGGATAGECRCSVKTFTCPKDLTCTVTEGTNEVALSWSGGTQGLVTGYEVRRNGALLRTLPATANSFEDIPTERSSTYSVTPLTDPPGLCSAMTCEKICTETIPFKIPLRINMGGAETVDSKENIWLGDGPGPGDPLCIRPDDGSGTNWIENWEIGRFQPDSLEALGFDPTHPGDRYIFNTIRWDVGADGIDFRMALVVPNGEYFVNMYFTEGCCTNRHFQIEIEGEIVEDDVSYLDYDPVTPALGRTGRLTFAADVADQLLEIGLLPCPQCPGATDTNAIINALEVIERVCVPGFQICPSNLSCVVDATGKVTGSWNEPKCLDLTGYEVHKDGALLMTLPREALAFTDTLTQRIAVYQVKPLVAGNAAPCLTLQCQAVAENIPFVAPVRLNMGGATTTDTRGRVWLGDGPGSGDPLSIRPDDLSGTNFIENWCVLSSLSNADSMQSLGFNPFDPRDQYILNTIRWDVGNDGIDFRMELPFKNGFYQVNLYFTECCCPNRHFQIELQGEVVDDDVSYLDYDPEKPALGRTGRLSFDAEVTDGFLKIGLLPCPECIDPAGAGIDTNAIVDAIEILPPDTPLVSCPRSLVLELEAGGKVTGTWRAGERVTISGYDLYRDGVKIGSLPGNATQFTDQPPCSRYTTYELVPLYAGADADFFCPGMRIRGSMLNPDCPFRAPLRINMGGVEVVDSHGNTWLGDGPGTGDPLEIRTDDLSGTNTIENWEIGRFQPDSLASLGFDPKHPADRYIFNTIRWDVGGDGIDFRMEFPMENGEYTVNMYFTEGCCTNRHFKIEIQDEIVDDDVSYLDYDPANPALGRTGRLTFEGIAVVDGILKIGLLPCPECPGAADTNAIIDALEILSAGPPRATFRRGDADASGRIDITDAVKSLAYQFLGEAKPECLDAADTDDSGTVDISDAIANLQFQFLGAGLPADPGPVNCGPDPKAEVPELGCDKPCG